MSDYGRHIKEVALALLGKPGETRGDEWRYGTHGSLAIDTDAGKWYDHESEEGGGTLDLIMRETGRATLRAAIAWLEEQGYEQPGKPEKPKQRARIAATYDYIDDNGELRYQVVRMEPKTFRQRKPDGEGWSWSVKGVEPLPYRLPEILAKPSATVIIAEGEKDVDRLTSMGFTATCNSGGAGKWPDSLSPWFRGRRVVLLPDNDDAGRNHADLVAGSLHPVADSVRVVYLPGLPEKGDPCDWVDAGGTKEALVAMCKDAEVWSPAVPDEPELPAATTEDDSDDAQPGQPFLALGYNGGSYFYLPRGTEQVASIRSGSHTSPAEMMSLAPVEWWEMAYPKEKGGVEWYAAASDCMRRCERRGVYSMRNVRGRGAWYDKGSSVLHLGNRLIVDGEMKNIIEHRSQYIYTRQAPMESIIDSDPATDAEAKEVFDLFGKLNWSKSVHGWLTAGWCALAPVCGAMPWRSHLWITAQRGAGKAQPLSSNVLTPSGWKKMGDLSVGDIITTPDNTHAHVVGLYPQGEKQIYKMTFSDGRSARATADHLWKVRERGMWRLRTTEQLIERVRTDSEWGRSAAIQMADPVDVKRNRKTNLPLHPYVLGALLGDGHLAGKPGQKAGEIRLTSFDEEITSRVRGLVPEWMGVFDTNREFHYRFGDLSRYGRKTRELVKELRLLGSRSDNKFIPSQYLEATIDERIELLKGLMDTDGTSGDNGCMSFCTVSERLADDFAYLVRSLGGSAHIGTRSPTYTHNGERRNGKRAYVVGVRLKDRSMAFGLQRKLDRVSGDYQYEDSFYLGIDSIEPDGIEAAQCIAIDHPDRLYITDDFVVTHNTWVQDQIIQPLLGQSALMVQGGTTEAGIRQALQQDARPVIFDEAESEDHSAQRRMKSVLELARQASSDGSAEIVKGTVNGHGMAFRIRSMFLLGSVNVSLTQGADESRFSVVSLDKPDKSPDEVQRFKEYSKHVGNTLTSERCASIRARTYELIPIIRQNAQTMAQAVAEEMGSQRIGDQVGTLLAGAISLSRSDAITLEDARQWAKGIDLSDAQEADDVSDEANCLNTILQTQVRFDYQRGSMQRSLSEVVLAAAGKKALSDDIFSDECNAILSRFGLQVADGRLVISNTHTELKRILRDTPWAAGWRRVLSRIPGACVTENSVRFLGTKTRAVSIPIDSF